MSLDKIIADCRKNGLHKEALTIAQIVSKKHNTIISKSKKRSYEEYLGDYRGDIDEVPKDRLDAFKKLVDAISVDTWQRDENGSPTDYDAVYKMEDSWYEDFLDGESDEVRVNVDYFEDNGNLIGTDNNIVTLENSEWVWDRAW